LLTHHRYLKSRLNWSARVDRAGCLTGSGMKTLSNLHDNALERSRLPTLILRAMLTPIWLSIKQNAPCER
jgi:hypothetical protein